jgi:copper chaperone CopZ
MTHDKHWRRNLGVLLLGLALAGGSCGCGEPAPPPPPAGEAGTYTFQVDGMHCDGCERSITTAVEALAGMQVLGLSHTNGVLKVQSDGRTSNEAVLAAIEPLGYRVAAAE